MHRPPDLQAFDDPDPLEEDDLTSVIEAKEYAAIKYRELRAKEAKGTRVVNAPDLIGTTVLHGPAPSGGNGLAQLEPPTPTWIGRSDTGRFSRLPSSSSSLSSSISGKGRSSVQEGAKASRPSSRPSKRVASVQMGNDETQPQDVQRPVTKKIKTAASPGVSSVSKPVPVPRSKSVPVAPFKRMPSRTPAPCLTLIMSSIPRTMVRFVGDPRHKCWQAWFSSTLLSLRPEVMLLKKRVVASI
ncbi:hypothetical protein BS47DRAFT_227162 [Hydnum rufescens UP504]|uniref:Uncharacterized protein n=1 Tax=Hydnum rufescens UP504 TaxID=1448309 RepID=A0A9P6B6K8_9AGAM|nr:hypothetical protein BS47DRAFT_227162 [Hydnum rufescens UP504]